ncbi:DUF1697 domain-containing protein [uncultured Paraglaciecola sp.]|uniref:DUF1697 domain-containing protein n=1 Tax=uncultured Paraglaciecola sp. TaxID=1765024 RepID=UPI00260F4DE5|nr:DUF1697 domain-containing protein [uncultured Paraglaciecola sp.]
MSLNSWIVLLRGINVGGNNILPMKKLSEMLLGLDCQNIQTYIQSGNVLLQHGETNKQILSQQISEKIAQDFGFKPQILLLTLAQFEQAAINNPYYEAQSSPKTLHLFFLAENALHADLDSLTALKKDSESFVLKDQVFYLHAPDGIGRSKLAEKVERHLGVPITARNWNTVSKLLALAKGK